VLVSELITKNTCLSTWIARKFSRRCPCNGRIQTGDVLDVGKKRQMWTRFLLSYTILELEHESDDAVLLVFDKLQE
jgi:hypothetical protein